jgi:hypothetical protein
MISFKEILNRYGDDAVVHTRGGEHHVRAFINPVISERYLKKWKTMTKLGEVNNSTYYYFGPPDCDIDDNGESYVTMNGVSYRFIRAEKYVVERVPSHWEAMLEIKEEDYDG